MNTKEELLKLPFVEDVKNTGGIIMQVGGAVRDSLLGVESKDLDLLISNIKVDDLINILRGSGKVDLVGSSFGVIKFKPFGLKEDIDIALPRTERKIGIGHQGFDVNVDPFIPLKTELFRRDFTINAIAKTLDGTLVDLFSGQDDLKDGIIRVLNPIAFSEDPLRMLRAVVFASRFEFDIEPITLELIIRNKHKIKEITSERILIELNKIVEKSNISAAVMWLLKTGLWDEIFSKGSGFTSINTKILPLIKSLGELIFILTPEGVNPNNIFDNKLPNEVKKELHSLNLLKKNPDNNERIFEALTHHPDIIHNSLFQIPIEFKNGILPRSIKELTIKGGDLLELGFVGVEIGEMMKKITSLILSNKLKNDRVEILNFVESMRLT